MKKQNQDQTLQSKDFRAVLVLPEKLESLNYNQGT